MHSNYDFFYEDNWSEPNMKIGLITTAAVDTNSTDLYCSTLCSSETKCNDGFFY